MFALSKHHLQNASFGGWNTVCLGFGGWLSFSRGSRLKMYFPWCGNGIAKRFFNIIRYWQCIHSILNCFKYFVFYRLCAFFLGTCVCVLGCVVLCCVVMLLPRFSSTKWRHMVKHRDSIIEMLLECFEMLIVDKLSKSEAHWCRTQRRINPSLRTQEHIYISWRKFIGTKFKISP